MSNTERLGGTYNVKDPLVRLELYRILLEAWEEDPKDRPMFSISLSSSQEARPDTFYGLCWFFSCHKIDKAWPGIGDGEEWVWPNPDLPELADKRSTCPGNDWLWPNTPEGQALRRQALRDVVKEMEQQHKKEDKG